MNITDVRIRKICTEGRLKAIVSITLDYDFAVHDIKVIDGDTRLFVAMPSQKDKQGVIRDVAHPISAQARELIEQVILSEYEKAITDLEQPPQ